MILKPYILLISAAPLLLLSCAKERGELDLEKRITFSVEEEFMMASTKVTPVTSLTSMYVSAVQGSAGSESDFFSNEVFTGSETLMQGGVFWPRSGDCDLSFYASNVPMSFSAGGTSVSVDGSTDVVVSYLPDADYGVINHLTFSHVQTRIGSLTVRPDDGYTVTDISISVTPKTSGVYNIRTAGWSSVTEDAPMVLATASGTVSPDLWLIPGDYDLVLSWSAAKGLYSETFSSVVRTVSLPAGRVSSFTVVLGGGADVLQDMILTVDRSEVVFDYTGAPVGASSINVVSKAVYPRGEEPVGWQTQVKVGDTWTALEAAVLEEGYEWLSAIPTGDASPSSLTAVMNVTVPAQEVTSHEDRLRELRVYDSGGTSPVDNSTAAGAVDLSMYDFVERKMDVSRYTANCYVVSSPGWYRFPLVYGNAIENGATNSASYNSSSSGTGHLNSFKNYKYDLPISDPWIENDWYSWLIRKNSVAAVTVQWQQYSRYDEGLDMVVTESGNQGVLSDVSVVSGDDGRYVQFRIVPENIRPGNILLCAKDAGGDTSDEEGESGALTMWSWHIWITDQTMTPSSVSNGTDSYGVLPVNTGWVDGSRGQWYAGRTAVLRLVSLADPAVTSDEFTVTQQEKEMVSVTGWGPYYQWGRKDPFVPGLFTYAANYDTGLRGAVRHPERFNSEVSTYFSDKYYDWATNNYNNLWDCNWTKYGTVSSALPTAKTVMDPSPRRFCVAPEGAWDGFVTYGHKGVFAEGYHFYTDSTEEETIFFPACGFIHWDGSLLAATDSRYWTLHAWASLQRRASYSLRLTNTSVMNAYYTSNHRAYGQPVRSVRYN